MNARKAEFSSKPDGSETLHSILLLSGGRKLNILDQNFRVAPRGMTFKTDSYFAPFTDLSIRLKLPPIMGTLNGKTIHCEGVVVECRGSHERKIYYVTVAFVNLSETQQKLLSLANNFLPAMPHPMGLENCKGLSSRH